MVEPMPNATLQTTRNAMTQQRSQLWLLTAGPWRQGIIG